MKKQLKLKNVVLASLLVIAGMASQSLQAQANQAAVVGTDDNSNVLRLLTSDKAVNITVTPEGINGEDQIHTVSMGKGDVLTIHGTVDQPTVSDPNNPNASLNSTLSYVELTVGKTKNWTSSPVSITTADKSRSVRIKGDELNDNTFDFHLTGDNNGEQRITVKAVWSVNGETQETKKYPIVVTVR